jgi:hypothetical protein
LRAKGVEHEVVGDDGRNLVAVAVKPAAILKLDVEAAAVCIGIGGEDDGGLAFGEGLSRQGGSGDFGIGRFEGDAGEAAVGLLVGRGEDGETEGTIRPVARASSKGMIFTSVTSLMMLTMAWSSGGTGWLPKPS